MITKKELFEAICALIEEYVPDEPERWEPDRTEWQSRLALLADIIDPMAMIALRALEIDPDWVADWEDPNQEKWCVDYNHTNSMWIFWNAAYMQSPGQHYMSKDTAIKICRELKSGFLQVGIGG